MFAFFLLNLKLSFDSMCMWLNLMDAATLCTATRLLRKTNGAHYDALSHALHIFVNCITRHDLEHRFNIKSGKGDCSAPYHSIVIAVLIKTTWAWALREHSWHTPHMWLSLSRTSLLYHVPHSLALFTLRAFSIYIFWNVPAQKKIAHTTHPHLLIFGFCSFFKL